MNASFHKAGPRASDDAAGTWRAWLRDLPVRVENHISRADADAALGLAHQRRFDEDGEYRAEAIVVLGRDHPAWSSGDRDADDLAMATFRLSAPEVERIGPGRYLGRLVDIALESGVQPSEEDATEKLFAIYANLILTDAQHRTRANSILAKRFPVEIDQPDIDELAARVMPHAQVRLLRSVEGVTATSGPLNTTVHNARHEAEARLLLQRAIAKRLAENPELRRGAQLLVERDAQSRAAAARSDVEQ